MLLVGYDDNYYIFNDPQKPFAPTYYTKESVEVAYAGLHSQAIVLLKGEEPYVQPEIPKVTNENPPISYFLNDFMMLEDLFKQRYEENIDPVTGGAPFTASMAVLGMTNLLRAPEYKGFEWYFTTGNVIDQGFIDYVKEHAPASYN